MQVTKIMCSVSLTPDITSCVTHK